jgi:metallo-beta-lactamase class B
MPREAWASGGTSIERAFPLFGMEKMMRLSPALIAGPVLSALLTLGGRLAGAAPHADPAQVKAHLAAAEEAADGDLKSTLGLCKAVEDEPVRTMEERRAGLRKLMAGRLEPMQVFDNLYFVGEKWVSAWAVKTSDGIILIDALNNDEEARTIIVPGLQKVGLNPADIKKVIITHAHGDHYGGIGYLIGRYHPQVVMSDADWKELEGPTLQFDVPEWGRPPKRDVTLGHGDTVSLGDTTLELVETPGHTTGTLSILIPLYDHGESHRALLWGGTAFNFGKRTDRLKMYIDSTHKAAVAVRNGEVDVLLSNHPGWDDSEPKMAALRTRKTGQPHPYVLGEPALYRFLNVAAECARATMASFDADALAGSN